MSRGLAGRGALYTRALRAEWRAAPGRLLFFVACLAIGVAAVVAVATHATALDRGIRGEARQLLAADVAVRGAQPIEPAAREFLATRGARLASSRELVTLVSTASQAGQSPSDPPLSDPSQPDQAQLRQDATPTGQGGADPPPRQGSSLLVELRAADPAYPFYGQLETSPTWTLAELADDQALVAPDLLGRLGLSVGDTLAIGGRPFWIVGTVDREPDRVGDVFTLGPRVLLTSAGLDRTGLEQFGSRVNHKLLAALPAELSEPAREELVAGLRDTVDSTRYRVETYADAQPSLRQALDRVARFVGLVALLSLLLGGVGIAYTLQSWLAHRIDDIAVLRCLGWRPRQVIALYVLQAIVLGLIGSLVGCVLGTASAAVLPRLAGDLMPVRELALWQPSAWGRGVGLGVGVALLFTLPPVLGVRRVPPLRVLRRDVEPVPMGWPLRLGVATVLLAGIWVAASIQSQSPARGLAFTAGLALATALLTLTTRTALRLVAPLARRARSAPLRQGLLALARPGAATVSACIALGLGILLVLAMRLVEVGLTSTLRSQLPEQAPSGFLIDIQPTQWPEVEALLAERGARDVISVPVVSARLKKVDGVAVEDLIDDTTSGDRRWGLTREQRLTFLDELAPDNRVVEGTLWGDPERAEVSLERDFAEETGLGLGSRLEYEIQGVAVEATVTSLRTVEWQTFGLNFFMVVEPGVLDDAPQTRVATVHLPAGGEQDVQDALAARFPNITLLRVRSILETLAAVLERLALGVRFLGAFTIVAGLIILASAVSAAASQRGREIALLKTLGMTRRQILLQSTVEHLSVGCLAAVVGAVGGNLLAWAVLTRGMELEWSFRFGTTLAAAFGCVLLTTLTALAAAWPALVTRPLAVLRGG